MPNTVLEMRVRACYRARACAAGIACGAQVFAVGAGAGIPLCLNAAYISALPTLPLAALGAFLCQRALCKAAKEPQRRGSAILSALLALTLTANAIIALSALISLAQRALLPIMHVTQIVVVCLLAVVLCALCGDTGVSRLCYVIRWLLPLGLLLLGIQSLSPEAPAKLFPLLGLGLPSIALSALALLGSVSPVLILLLPPPALREAGEEAQRCPVPSAGFFIRHVLSGVAVGIAMLCILSMCNAYESLRIQLTWGQRMTIMCCSEPRITLFKFLLTLLQACALTLCAISTFSVAAEASARACPRLGRSRFALLPPFVLCAAAFAALIAFGFDIAFRAAPLLLLPLFILLVFSRRL